MKKYVVTAAVLLVLSSSSAFAKSTPNDFVKYLSSNDSTSALKMIDEDEVRAGFINDMSTTKNKLNEISKVFNDAASHNIDEKMQEGSILVNKISDHLDLMVSLYKKQPEFFNQVMVDTIREYPNRNCKYKVLANSKHPVVSVNCGDKYTDKYTLTLHNREWKVTEINYAKVRMLNSVATRIANMILHKEA
ncbi:hypothetical protein [Photobacterium kishitanii]|uniref:DUF3828 domain-containing protein n=1 Tax=Photobacterium kishitanii TaxID=318456 RepID=A0A2T3KMJ2_9GAMM|nr:hypothetical protein [Photobacterium kishitanii]PSV01019.1 hypothetical protein C9J27_03045 [Photobacterium kishitanii]